MRVERNRRAPQRWCSDHLCYSCAAELAVLSGNAADLHELQLNLGQHERCGSGSHSSQQQDSPWADPYTFLDPLRHHRRALYASSGQRPNTARGRSYGQQQRRRSQSARRVRNGDSDNNNGQGGHEYSAHRHFFPRSPCFESQPDNLAGHHQEQEEGELRMQLQLNLAKRQKVATNRTGHELWSRPEIQRGQPIRVDNEGYDGKRSLKQPGACPLAIVVPPLPIMESKDGRPHSVAGHFPRRLVSFESSQQGRRRRQRQQDQDSVPGIDGSVAKTGGVTLRVAHDTALTLSELLGGGNDGPPSALGSHSVCKANVAAAAADVAPSLSGRYPANQPARPHTASLVAPLHICYTCS